MVDRRDQVRQLGGCLRQRGRLREQPRFDLGGDRGELGVGAGEVVVHGPDRHARGPGGRRRGQRRPAGVTELRDERLDDRLLGVLAAGLPGGAVVGPGDGHPAGSTSRPWRAATASTVPMSGGSVVTSASSCSKNSRAGPGPVMVRKRQPGLPLR